MDYQNSNRKKLKDALGVIFAEKKLNMRELSLAIGCGEGYLCHVSKECVFNTAGDISDKKLEGIMMQLNNKKLTQDLLYEKSRRFKLKQRVLLAAKELNVSAGDISLLVSNLLKDPKASAHYLSNRMTISCFSRKGDMGVREFNLLLLTIGKAVKLEKDGEQFMISRNSGAEHEQPVGAITYKRLPFAKLSDTDIAIDTSFNPYDSLESITHQSFNSAPTETLSAYQHGSSKKPTLLNPEQIAEKLKQYMNYSSALWVDGHLVLSESLGANQ